MTNFVKFSVFVLCFVCFVASAKSVVDRINEAETVLKTLATTISQRYSNKCTAVSECKDSYGAYGRVIPGNSADLDSRISFTSCGNCTPGRMVSNSYTGVLRSSAPSENFTQDELEDICWSSSLDSLLLDAYKQHNSEATDNWLSVEFTTPSGIEKQAPFIPETNSTATASLSGRLSSGDYGSVASGPKDVIFVIDYSASLSRNQYKKEIAFIRDMMHSTLSLGDYYAVIAMSNKAKLIVYDEISNETKKTSVKTMKAVTGQVDFEFPSKTCGKGKSGGTKLAPALEVALETFTNSYNKSYSSGCDAHIVVITDGKIQARPLYQANRLHNTFRLFENRTGRALHIHTYSLDKEAKDDELAKLSCQHDGITINAYDYKLNYTSFINAWNDFSAMQRAYVMADSPEAYNYVHWTSPTWDNKMKSLTVRASIPVYGKIHRAYSVCCHYSFISSCFYSFIFV